MNFKIFTQYILTAILFLCGTMPSIFSQCEIGSSPDCPYVYNVCSGEQAFITMGDVDIPPPPIVIIIDVGEYDYSYVDYTFSIGDNIVCTNCYYLLFAQHDETTLYTVEWVNPMATFPYQSSGTKYILVEVDECELSTDIGDVRLTKPSQINSTGNQTVSYDFTNIGSGYLYSYDIFLEINGELIEQKHIDLSAPINSGSWTYGNFDPYYFEALESGYTIKVWVANPNGLADTDLSNNTVEVQFDPFILEYNIGLEVISPKLPFENGDNDIKVQVRNFGNIEIDEYTINWSINGQTQPAYNGVNLLANKYEVINLGSRPLDTNNDYEILFNVELPNGFADSDHSNNEQSFIYENENYEYYLTDEFYEICPGDSVNLKYIGSYIYAQCYDCVIRIEESSWSINGIEFSTENDLWITPDTSVIIQLTGTTKLDCNPFGCNPTGPAGPYPTNPTPIIESTFGIIVNNCDEEPEPPIETPNCADHAGTIFFATCENEQYFFIETSEGIVLDPYFSNGIVFNYYDGQSINFDYEAAAFTTPCANAQEAVIITCIEEAESPEPPKNTNTAIFSDFSWLNNIVDSTDCSGTTIEVYDLGAYAFINIITTEATILYFEDGTYYCQNGNNLNCVDAYGLSNPTSTWTCGDDTTTPNNGITCEFDDIKDLQWMQDIIGTLNQSYSINIYEANGSTIIGFRSNAADSGSAFYNCSGELICTFSGLGELPTGPGCLELEVAVLLETILISDLTTPTNNEIFTTYSFLGNLVDQNNCEGTTVNVFDLGAYAFVQIIDNDNATLYFEDGTFYCQDGNNLNCVDVYSLGNPTATWTCGQVTTEPPTPTNNEIFTTFSFLENLVDQSNCEGTTVNVFDLGAYSFVQIIDNDNATLYFEDGTFYCQDGNNLNCVDAYSLGNATDTWTCGVENPNPPTTTPAMFDKYPWLSNLYSSTNCNGSYESITEYDLGPYAFIYVQGNDFAMLYFEDGTPYCNNADFDCLDLYSLTDPTDITLCSVDKPAGDGSEKTNNEHAYKTPVELVPIWVVYPNPNSGSFTIRLNDQNDDLNLISIYDIRGKVIDEVLLNENQTELQFNLEHLNIGMYFVALQYGDKTEVKKLMIKR